MSEIEIFKNEKFTKENSIFNQQIRFTHKNPRTGVKTGSPVLNIFLSPVHFFRQKFVARQVFP